MLSGALVLVAALLALLGAVGSTVLVYASLVVISLAAALLPVGALRRTRR